jgi:hypothetical protein
MENQYFQLVNVNFRAITKSFFLQFIFMIFDAVFR